MFSRSEYKCAVSSATVQVHDSLASCRGRFRWRVCPSIRHQRFQSFICSLGKQIYYFKFKSTFYVKKSIALNFPKVKWINLQFTLPPICMKTETYIWAKCNKVFFLICVLSIDRTGFVHLVGTVHIREFIQEMKYAVFFFVCSNLASPKL